MAFVAVFQPPPDVWSAATFITLALFLGIGTGGVFAWVARRAPARSVGSVTGIVAAAGGLGGYFPPLVMGATYNAGRQQLHDRAAAAGGHRAHRLRRTPRCACTPTNQCARPPTRSPPP